MNDYKPGMIAKATVRGVPDVTVMRASAASGDFWFAPERGSGDRYHPDRDVTDVRPLIVLDLEGFNVRALADTFRKMGFGVLARQIEAQTRPAIEEPKGLGAVVEDEDGSRWVRVHDAHWDNGTHCLRWSAVCPVRVLSEGVQP